MMMEMATDALYPQDEMAWNHTARKVDPSYLTMERTRFVVTVYIAATTVTSHDSI